MRAVFFSPMAPRYDRPEGARAYPFRAGPHGGRRPGLRAARGRLALTGMVIVGLIAATASALVWHRARVADGVAGRVGGADLRPAMARVLTAHYYRDVDVASLLRAPVETWPTALDDPYTHVLTPEAVATLSQQDEGRYAGIGIHAHATRDAVVIDTVFDGSPAADAGLRAGDVLAGVDGVALTGNDLDAVLAQVRGPLGSAVTVTVERDRAPLTATMVRAPVTARLVWSERRVIEGQRVGVVTIVEFGDGVGEEARSAVEALMADGVDRLVLDLRRNPGGLVAEAVSVASVFVPAGTSVLIERGRHIDTHTVRTRLAPVTATLPLSVLIDGNSASASEIVAGALRDAGRAPLVGARSFGKGVIQDVYALPGGWGMKATFAEYLTPAGNAIDRSGLLPDVLVASAALADDDPALAAAVATGGVVQAGAAGEAGAGGGRAWGERSAARPG